MTNETEPECFVGGLETFRVRLTRATFTEEQQGLRWQLYPGMLESKPYFAVLGDLTIRTADAFVGVTALAQVSVRGLDSKLTEEDWGAANELTERYQEVFNYVLYDYAAHLARGLIGGTSFKVDVPWITPEVTIRKATEPTREEGSTSEPTEE